MMRRVLSFAVLALSFAACKFDSAYRDITEPGPTPCTEGTLGCLGTQLSRCENGAEHVVEDCAARQLVCAPGLGA